MLDLLIQRRSSSYTGGIRPSEDNALMRLGGKRTMSGKYVDEESADTIAAWFCGRVLISDTFKSLPLKCYEDRGDEGRHEARDLSAGKLVRSQPNPDMHVSRLLWLVPWWTITWGRFLAEIERFGNGEPRYLWPIHPSRVKTLRMSDGRIVHRVYRNAGGEFDDIADENMINSFRFSNDGITGISVIGKARESLGLTLASDQFGARFYGTDAMPRIAITTADDLDDEHKKALKREWIREYGSDDSDGIAILSGGTETKIERLGMPPEDAQFLTTRQYQAGVEIGRWLQLNPIKLKEMGRATWGNSEQVALEYIGEAVLPYCIDFEQECRRKLLREDQQEQYYFEFNLDGALRAESNARADMFVKGLTNGWLNVDEVRKFLNMNPLPNGEGQIYMRPANLIAAGDVSSTDAQANQDASAGPEPEPTPPDAQTPANMATDAIESVNETARAAVMGLIPMMANCIERMGRVESNAGKRIAKAKDAARAADEFWTDHEATVNSEFGVVFDSAVAVANGAGASDVSLESARKFTAAAAAAHCLGRRSNATPPEDEATRILSAFCMEYLR